MQPYRQLKWLTFRLKSNNMVNLMRIFSLVFFLLSFTFAGIYSDWETITDMNDIQDLVIVGEMTWSATTGGIYSYNSTTEKISRYTNIEGLSSISIQALAIDDKGFLFAGGKSGIIEILNTETGEWQGLFDIEGNEIKDILYHSDTLWIAAGKGLAVYPWDGTKYKFKDFFRNFDIIPNAVSKITLFAGKIWLGTDKGLLSAPADINKYTINDPAMWDVYTTGDGLATDVILDLKVIDNRLWVGTSGGLVTIDASSNLQIQNSWGTGSDAAANVIFKSQNNIYIANNPANGQGRLYVYHVNEGKTLIKTFNNLITCLNSDESGNLWIGLINDGIYNFASEKYFKLDGPGINAIRFVVKDSGSNIWASSGKFRLVPNEGFSFYNNDLWTHIDFKGNGWSDLGNTDFIKEDPNGNVWLATWGGGLMVKNQDEFKYFHNYNTAGTMIIEDKNSSTSQEIPPIDDLYKNFFVGVDGYPNYEVISYLNVDNFGRLWIANYIATNDKFIAIAKYTNNGFVSFSKTDWIYLDQSIFPGIGDGEISCIAFDDFYHAYIGTYRNGVFVINYQAQSSASFVKQLTVADNLYNNRILFIEKDQDGIMWIGTSSGLNSYDGVNLYRHVGDPEGKSGPLDNQINQIFVDEANNKWFATAGGLSILRGERSPWDSTAWIGFNTENSGLVDNYVYSVYVDPEESEALIGTDNGLSIYRGSFAEIQEDYDKMIGGPNPFIINSDENKFIIRNLLYNSEVKILTLNGRLVRKLKVNDNTVDGGRAEWDGLDLHGRLVASGVYLYFAYSENGKSKAGKVAVIRK